MKERFSNVASRATLQGSAKGSHLQNSFDKNHEIKKFKGKRSGSGLQTLLKKKKKPINLDVIKVFI